VRPARGVPAVLLPGVMMRPVVMLGPALMLLVVAGCATGSHIDQGVFHSAKGYRVTLPTDGWTVEPGSRADLSLKSAALPGGMLVDATCQGREPSRPLDVLTRHLTFGLTHRDVVETGTTTVAGHEAARSVVRGTADGRDVTVEAVVLRAEPCVHDFLYVAPTGVFGSGRPAFRALVDSFAPEAR
jgi:hypothetical protein